MGGTGGGDLSGGGYLFDVSGWVLAVVGGGLQLFAVVGPEFLRGGWPQRLAKRGKRVAGRDGRNPFFAKATKDRRDAKKVRKRGEPDCLMSAGAGS